MSLHFDKFPLCLTGVVSFFWIECNSPKSVETQSETHFPVSEGVLDKDVNSTQTRPVVGTDSLVGISHLVRLTLKRPLAIPNTLSLFNKEELTWTLPLVGNDAAHEVRLSHVQVVHQTVQRFLQQFPNVKSHCVFAEIPLVCKGRPKYF